MGNKERKDKRKERRTSKEKEKNSAWGEKKEKGEREREDFPGVPTIGAR